jgi:macrolide transport system ATP-binding/permease protein
LQPGSLSRWQGSSFPAPNLCAFLEDLGFGARLLRRSPIFTFAVVSSLGLGIGLNTAVFSLFDALLLKPVPGVSDLARLVTIHTQVQGSSSYVPVSYLNFRDLQQGVRSLSGLASYQLLDVALSANGKAEQVSCQLSSWNYFDVLGVKPSLGRFFLEVEDRTPSSHPVVVLSHGLWQRGFAGDARIIGKQILINRHPFTIVGVAAEGFRGINSLAPAQLWVPTMMYRELATWANLLPTRDNQMLLLFGRVRHGFSYAQASAELRIFAARLATEYPDDNRNQTLIVLPLRTSLIHPNSRGAFVRSGSFLLGIAALLLVLSCMNVANLLLVRAFLRQREFALRECMGADRKRLVGQLLTESLLLTLIAAVTGVVLAIFGAQLLWSLRPPFLVKEILVAPLDGRGFLFALAASLLTGLLFGLIPALHTGRRDLTSALQGRHSCRGSQWRVLLGDLLVIFQVALCFVGLACTSFFVRGLLGAQQINPGFDPAHLATLSFNLMSQGLDEARGRAFTARVREQIASLPGVASVGLAENRVLAGVQILRSVQTERAKQDTARASDPGILVRSNVVDAQYFETIGLPILEGRPFEVWDRTGTQPVAIVSHTMAKKFWPGQSPVGKIVFLDQEPSAVAVVGVAQDARMTILEAVAVPLLYLPAPQRYTPLMTLHIRTMGNPRLLLPAMREKLHAFDRSLPWAETRLVSEIIDESLWWPHLGAWLLTCFTAMAVALVTMGIYGLTAYQVSRRNFEFGVRLSLGAERAGLIGLIVRQGCLVAATGLLVGALAAFALQRWMASFFYGGGTTSVASLIGIGILLLCMSLVANLLPALRIARMEPTALLRMV